MFDTIYKGTLYGKWPTAAVWASLLPLFDKDGVLDLSIEAICGMTGWPRDLLEKGIAALCEPDPYSRSKDEDGRRMVLIDSSRPWGWRAVNHYAYKEKARLKAKSEREIRDGLNAERMRDRRGPPETADTAADPLSNANANASSEQQPRGKRSVAARGSRIPIPYEPSEGLREWAKSKTPDIDVTAAAAEFVDFWRAVPGQRGCKLDWEATFRNRLRELQGRVRQTRRSGTEERGNGLKVLNP